jgi:hypothetical protein
MLSDEGVPAFVIQGGIIMSLHTGSSIMAHNLDRFSYQAEFEDIAGEAARLDVSADTVRMYLDWYGSQLVTVKGRTGVNSMPAYEAEIRWQVLGERIKAFQ